MDCVVYLDGPLESLLDVQPLAHNGLVQLPFKGQQVHVSLRLWDQLSDLVQDKDKHTHNRGGGSSGHWWTRPAGITEK